MQGPAPPPSSMYLTLKPLILTSIMDHYASGKKIVENNLVEDTNIYNDEKDSEVVKQMSCVWILYMVFN